MSELIPVGNDITPNKSVDAKNIPSPLPLLRLKKELVIMESGDILQIDCTDLGSRDDISSWCSRNNNSYLGEKNMGSFTSFFIMKK